MALVIGATAIALALPGAAASTQNAGRFPSVISLPNGFQPEGIDIAGTKFYTGSLIDGSIYRGDLRNGQGQVLVPGVEGEAAFGLEIDRRNRLFVAEGPGGGARVYDAGSGDLLASYQFTPTGSGLIHDVVVTRRAAYFTDSLQPVLYVVPMGRRGQLGGQDSVRTLPLSGDLHYQDDGAGCPAVPDLNLTGIELSPDGRRLISVQFNTGTAFSIDPTTGVARAIDLGGARLNCGNSLLRRGHTLYVVQPVGNQVSVLRLGRSYTSAELKRTITDPRLDFPTAAGIFGASLYTANARFATPPTPETEYQIVRLPAR